MKELLTTNVANLRHNVEVAYVQGRSSIMLECHAAEWIAAELTRLAEVARDLVAWADRDDSGLFPADPGGLTHVITKARATLGAKGE